jgi:hypothetical protein
VELFNIAAVFLLITSIILIIYTMEREREFIAYNSSIQESSVGGAAYAINLQLQNKHRHVRLFLEEYAQLFSYLESFPDHDVTNENINTRLQQRFPDFFAFTITDQKGVPILTDVESLVGEVCQNDLSTYVGRLRGSDASLHNESYVHPQPFNYHYDIMAPLQTRYSGVRVFFSSFHLDEIADILKTHARPGQNLLLVRQTQPALIEVTSEGARDKLTRAINLTDQERSRISVFQDIPDTDWRLVNLMDETSEQKYIDGLWAEVVVILIIVTFALITLVMVLLRRSRKDRNRE